MAISQAIINDHRELEQAYNNIKNARDEDEKTRWRNQFTWELARHSIGEELVVYPAFEKHLPDGKEIADKDRREHLTVSRSPLRWKPSGFTWDLMLILHMTGQAASQ
jgi:hemerythrin superfamily protein